MHRPACIWRVVNSYQNQFVSEPNRANILLGFLTGSRMA